MQLHAAACSIAHSIICTRLFRGKIHSDWFNGMETLQGRWQHGEKVVYRYPSGLEETLCQVGHIWPAGQERLWRAERRNKLDIQLAACNVGTVRGGNVIRVRGNHLGTVEILLWLWCFSSRWWCCVYGSGECVAVRIVANSAVPWFGAEVTLLQRGPVIVQFIQLI